MNGVEQHTAQMRKQLSESRGAGRERERVSCELPVNWESEMLSPESLRIKE